ncbi:MAG: DegT/DnrJ/EryC1/StrS family aminotransferase [Bryobacteraceae bacterium]
MPNNGRGSTRRLFVGSGTAAALARGAQEALALEGGPKAVTLPAAEIAKITKWPRYGEEEKQAILDLLENGRWYGEIPAFEKELKEYLKVPYVKAHSSGTSSLMSLFFALNLPPGSEIMAPSYTAWATTAPMHLFQYVPVFIDINPRTMCFDLEYAAKRLTKLTRAVIPMHSFGNPCDMDQICDFAGKHGLIVLEDAAQAQGASLQGRPMGTWGAMGIFSHQSSKILPAIEGGSGTYQTREYYERATVFGAYELAGGFPADSPYRKYQGTGMGPKFRIHSLAAALARRQLRRMDEQTALEDRQVRRLTARLVELPGLSVPYCRPDAKRVYWGSHMVFIDEAKAGCPKETLVKALRAEGVAAGPGAYDEQHKYALYSEAKWWHHPPVIPNDLAGTTQVNRQSVRLPVFRVDAPELIEQYVKAFEKVWAKRSQLAKA